jgi:GT2 family glycosyltransferase
MERPSVEIWISVHGQARDLSWALEALPWGQPWLAGVGVAGSGCDAQAVARAIGGREGVRVRLLPSDAGPCGSRNAAIRECAAPWLLLLDGDCAPSPAAVERLLDETIADPGAAVYGARLVYESDPARVYFDGGQAHFLGLLCLENAHARERETVAASREAGALATSAWLLDPRAARRAGLFDEGYRMHGEDLDLSVRLRLLGLRLRHVPQAVVLHRKTAAAPTGELSRQRARWHPANRWRTLLKACEAATLLRTAPLQAAYELASLAHSARRGEASLHLRGLADLLPDLPRLLRRRRELQRSRVRSDEQVFSAPALSWRPQTRAAAGAAAARGAFEALSRLAWRP